MKRLILKPADFPLQYKECPPGLFLWGESVGLKTEYGQDGFCDTGETFCRPEFEIVTPLRYEWEEI